MLFSQPNHLTQGPLGNDQVWLSSSLNVGRGPALCKEQLQYLVVLPGGVSVFGGRWGKPHRVWVPWGTGPSVSPWEG